MASALGVQDQLFGLGVEGEGVGFADIEQILFGEEGHLRPLLVLHIEPHQRVLRESGGALVEEDHRLCELLELGLIRSRVEKDILAGRSLRSSRSLLSGIAW